MWSACLARCPRDPAARAGSLEPSRSPGRSPVVWISCAALLLRCFVSIIAGWGTPRPLTNVVSNMFARGLQGADDPFEPRSIQDAQFVASIEGNDAAPFEPAQGTADGFLRQSEIIRNVRTSHRERDPRIVSGRVLLEHEQKHGQPANRIAPRKDDVVAQRAAELMHHLAQELRRQLSAVAQGDREGRHPYAVQLYGGDRLDAVHVMAR